MSSKPPTSPTTPTIPVSPSSLLSGSTLVVNSSTPKITFSKVANTSNGSTLQFRRKLNHLSTPLAPLLSITSGISHPSFPLTILHYHLLTESQLNELAHHYHQRTPSEYSLGYPMPVVGRWWVHTTEVGDVRGAEIEEKRRRFGRFVGLRGCESPYESDLGDEAREREQRSMELWVESEMRRRQERAERELMGRGKGCW
ncbi:MAG: hypothetical protein Q9220_001424 [cf. Caloplaca sp. 1 TL-2023]